MATYIEAIAKALDEEMSLDDGVCVLGEDVATGGAFGTTKGLAERFGTLRVRNTPISEGTVVGTATGAALAGLRPVVEVMFIDFITLAMDQLVNQAAKLRYMSGGQLQVPMVLRTQAGIAGGAGAQHSQSLESWFVHVPGLKVVAPSSASEAYLMLKAAIRDENPVVFIEHKKLYASREDLPRASGEIELTGARIVREGHDVTLVSWSAAVRDALEAAGQMDREGVSVEVIDLRSLYPLDLQTLQDSLAKTHRLVVAHEAVLMGGLGGEVTARLQETAFDELDAPILRVGAKHAPIPFAPSLERAIVPGVPEILDGIRRVME